MTENVDYTSNDSIHRKANVDKNENDNADILSIENTSLINTIMQVIIKQVTTIVVDLLNKHMGEFKDFSIQNHTDIKKLQKEIYKVSSNMKEVERYFNKHNNSDIEQHNNIQNIIKNHIQLKQDIRKIEKQLKQDMKQQQFEMEKINKLFKCHLNIDTSADCARMVDFHNTIENRANKYCTRIPRTFNGNKNSNNNINNGSWNNFDKMEYFASKNNFHGKFLLRSNDYNIFDETSLSNYCNQLGFNSDILDIQTAKNNYSSKPTFVIQITHVFWRMEFLNIIKSNNYLSITLFSHNHNNNNNGSNNYRSNVNGINKWFKKRWRMIQRL